MKTFYVYILTNPGRTLYVGMTNDLVRRMYEHRNRARPGFAAKCGIDQLVIYEEVPTANEAIAREKQIKNWRREKKVALINEENPQWRDLSEGWYE